VSTPRTFDEVAAAQGWDADSREQVLKDFIATGGGDIDDYAQKRALEENEGAEEGIVPPLQMDVVGEYTGNPYPEQYEYRVHMAQETGPDHVEKPVVLWIENSSGGRVGQAWFSPEEIDGIRSMSQIDHGLGGYDDDWTIPVGMDRQLTWTMPTEMDHTIRIDESQIDEIAQWLTFVLGEEEWTGGDEWEW
jgi:hypothetical protein